MRNEKNDTGGKKIVYLQLLAKFCLGADVESAGYGLTTAL